MFSASSNNPSALFGGGDVVLLMESNSNSANGGVTKAKYTAPASPTAPLSDHEEEEEKQDDLDLASRGTAKLKQNRRSMFRRVRFDSETKQHDGLSPRSDVLETVITRYFVDRQEVSELDVMDMCEKSVQAIKFLHEDLSDIISRLEKASLENVPSVPVLMQGGGMCTKLCCAHLPYVKTLDRVVEAAAVRQARSS